jgi:hypothetical protein
MELKLVIAENDTNLSKLKQEVVHVYNFIVIMEEYCY